MRCCAKIRRRSRIDPRFSWISARQCKRPHAEPLRTQILLVGARNREAILVLAVDDLEALPVINVHDRMTISVTDAFISRKQWPVDVNVAALVGGIIRVRDHRERRVWRPIRLPGTIVDEPGGNGVVYQVANARWIGG